MTVSFPDHRSLLTAFLDRRSSIVDDIERRLLNVQGKAALLHRNPADFEHAFSSCFFDAAGLPRGFAHLRGQLASAHVAAGFEPVRLEQRLHELDPIQLVSHAYDYWDRHRWPGRKGRLAFAETLYSVFVLQQLQQLSLRIWDDGHDRAGDQLRDIQVLLDRLNAARGPGVFIRDARWLIQTAQGPLTRHLQPYFTIAERISSSLSDADRLEAHTSGVKLAGGHLRSQLRYRAGETGLAADDPKVLVIARNSNSMDAALLVGDLVPLLEAYEVAHFAGDVEQRQQLADAILQGISADPELFLADLSVLGPCTMIEEVFIERDGRGSLRYTRAGAAHFGRLTRSQALVGKLTDPLTEDVLALAERGRVYSPFGIVYGFCADLLANMAMDPLRSQPPLGLSLEDMFVSGGEVDSKAARAHGWGQLPTQGGGHEHFEHSLDWGRQVLERTRTALRRRAAREAAPNASTRLSGRLFLVPESRSGDLLPKDVVPEGTVSAQEHYVTSDLQRALSNGATAFPKSQIVVDRKEGRFLASVDVDGKWFAVSKAVLTACICQGRDALITDLPEPLVEILRLTGPELVEVVSG